MGRVTSFEVGDVVRARESVQGMVRGAEYEVCALRSRALLGSVFVEYELMRGDGGTFWVCNGPFVLDCVRFAAEGAAR
jgi:hypothetical protein